MGKFIDAGSLTWKPVRPDVASDVFGKVLLDGPTKAVLTRVAPGGRFAPHRDPYGHLFYVLEGQGRVLVGKEEHAVGPGSAIRIVPGEEHGYENTGSGDLVLLSLNLPEKSLPEE